jgi:hypothetical protein
VGTGDHASSVASGLTLQLFRGFVSATYTPEWLAGAMGCSPQAGFDESSPSTVAGLSRSERGHAKIRTASGVLPFPDPEQAPSATETEQVGIAICPAEEIVPDDLGSDEAEGDAIPTITQREIGVRKSGMDANVS